VSGAVTAGITAQAGIAFYAMGRLFDGMGSWEALIGGVLLIVTAILNPEGIAGGIRLQVAAARAKKEQQALASTAAH
jgi:branched-chain amino acid transport system permease protein